VCADCGTRHHRGQRFRGLERREFRIAGSREGKFFFNDAPTDELGNLGSLGVSGMEIAMVMDMVGMETGNQFYFIYFTLFFFWHPI
jgi:hypothetical protein